MQTTLDREISYACSGILLYQRMQEAQVLSMLVKTAYEQAYYAGCTCNKGKAPLDEQFGLVPGAVTASLAPLLALAASEFSYDESPK
jgi:hypothetical protein